MRALRPDVTDIETRWANLVFARSTFRYAPPRVTNVHDPARQDVYAKTERRLSSIAGFDAFAQYTKSLCYSSIYTIVYLVSLYFYACQPTFKTGCL